MITVDDVLACLSSGDGVYLVWNHHWRPGRTQEFGHEVRVLNIGDTLTIDASAAFMDGYGYKVKLEDVTGVLPLGTALERGLIR